MSPRKPEIDEMRLESVVNSYPQRMAEEFNIFNNSLFTWEKSLTVLIYLNVTLPSVNTIITVEKVRTSLLQTHAKKSAGPDNIPSEYLNRYNFSMSTMLARIFRASVGSS